MTFKDRFLESTEIIARFLMSVLLRALIVGFFYWGLDNAVVAIGWQDVSATLEEIVRFATIFALVTAGLDASRDKKELEKEIAKLRSSDK